MRCFVAGYGQYTSPPCWLHRPFGPARLGPTWRRCWPSLLQQPPTSQWVGVGGRSIATGGGIGVGCAIGSGQAGGVITGGGTTMGACRTRAGRPATPVPPRQVRAALARRARAAASVASPPRACSDAKASPQAADFKG